MLNFLGYLAVQILRGINIFFRPLSLRDKVTIISRQANEPTLDIQLLRDCLESRDVDVVVMAKTMEKTFVGMLTYAVHQLKQMYHIATSKVIIVDGYCLLVSILPKKQNQKVIQMWHALGAIKKFGWQSTDNPDGHSRKFAEIVNMHGNYDYVLAPSRTTGDFFAEAFRIPMDKLAFYGLPRIDFIREDDLDTKQNMVSHYPEIESKENVLYVPTFRKNAVLHLEQFVNGFDFAQYNLIIKKHFLDKGDYSWAEKQGAIVDTRFTSLEWLRICRKVITDYSAIAFEAAILDRDIYIYQPDVNSYKTNVGLNVNLYHEAIGAYVCKNEEELFSAMHQPYSTEAVMAFREKYIEIDMENCTGKLCDFIMNFLTD